MLIKFTNPNMSVAKVLLTKLFPDEIPSETLKSLVGDVDLPSGTINIDPQDSLVDASA